ncbi:hypothetical protein FH972_026724 [Carpinus fangiana]|uniref:Berberine/berberine-like domain-containing protein n=1 Tax=Carpinus fangiana TaxID=176857 RepID=A0A5N6L542_9ROSI|nr:hypothetical protein FH972_026724 [Carpinus fangiana]
MKASITHLKAVAIEEGIYPKDYTMYPNYSISNTTAENLYGAKNAARLRRIKRAVDKDNIMGLAGGFSI